jgi:hypothetical protein
MANPETHSRHNLLRVIGWMILCVTAILAVSYVYSALDLKSNTIGRILLFAFYLSAIGIAGIKTLKFSGLDPEEPAANKQMACIVGTTLGLIAVYILWLTFVKCVKGHFFVSPFDLASQLADIAEHGYGVDSYLGRTRSGQSVSTSYTSHVSYSLWVIESVIVLIAGGGWNLVLLFDRQRDN